MRIKVVFVIHLIALFTILSSIHATKLRRNRKLLKKRLEHILHPCVTAPKDTVVHSLNGDIMCLRKTEEELEKQLESNGGYNRRYAAASLVEARRNFKNMFNVYGKDYENTTGWQEWRFSSVRDVSPKEYSRNNPVLKKASFFEKDEGKDRMFKKDRGEGRQRRSNDDSNITKREDNGTNIQCLPGGRKTEKGIHLCPACQRCTELPEFFFPRYINELTCDDSKSGYSSQVGCYLSQNFQIGSCHQIKMTIDLLVHKNGKFAVVFKNETLTKFQQVYEPYTHEISTCCECMVFSTQYCRDIQPGKMIVIKVSIPVYVTIVAMAIMKECYCKPARPNDRMGIQPNKRVAVHPCDNVENNTVIHTSSGDVLCRLPSNDKLRQKLDIVGGYNRHYVSRTLDEAKVHFKNLFEAYGQNYTNTSDWQSWHIKDSSLDDAKETGDMESPGDSGSVLVKRRESSNSSNIQCLAGGRETNEGVHFCPACQRYTELPAKLYPRYLNELTCDDSHSGSSTTPGCYLSGNFQIGTCRQINMTIDLLSHQNGQYTLTYENETVKIYEALYETVTQELRISCECLGFPNLVNP